MSFHSPEYLLLLVLAVGLFLWIHRSKKDYPSLKFPITDRFRKLKPTWKVRFIRIPMYLHLLALVLLIIALARPQKSDTRVKRNVEGIDILIALDISDSMLIEDMKPLNRIESAKSTIAQFVQKRSSDRIGLIVFAGESFTLVPLTLDYELLLKRVSEISTARKARIKDGTAIGVALANAAGRLKESTAKSRVIIFMTDGENNSGTIDPETGLEIAKGFGHKIYSIAIGRSGPTQIPVYQEDPFGNVIKHYQPFESTVNEPLLQKMASDTGGKFYMASKEDSLNGVFSEIDRLEKTKVDVNKYTRYHELYFTYALAGLTCMAFGFLLSLTVFRRQP